MNVVRVLLLVVAVLFFLLAAFHAPVPVDLTNFGLAAFAGSFLIPRLTPVP
jgi:hypothetical protein